MTLSARTAPLTAAHHALIRMLAEQSAREWLLGQRQATDESHPQKQEGAGEVAPSRAPSTPTL